MKPEDGKHDEQEIVDAEQRHLGGGQRHDPALFIGGVILLGAVMVIAIPVAAAGPARATVGYAVALLLWVTLARVARLRSIRPTRTALVVAALCLRMPFLFVDPALSDDVQRYRWDGLVSASGVSPYAYAPDAPELTPLSERFEGSVNHPDIPTIYPPLAQFVFWIWGLTGAGLWLWRLLLLVADLVVVRVAGAPLALFWATCPFVIFEGVWSGHIEGLVAVMLLGCCVLAERGRETSSLLIASAAAGLKLTPVAALPSLVRHFRKRWIASTLVVLALIVPFLPFVGGPLMPGFGEYATRWEFNSPLYEAMKWAVDVTGFDRLLKMLFTSIKDPLGLEPLSGLVYAHLYPAWIARALGLLPFAILMAFAMKRASLEGRMAWSVAALLLASPTIHPWYWLAILPLAVRAEERLLSLLVLSSPLSYAWYVDAVVGKVAALVLSYGLPVVVWVLLKRRKEVLESPHAHGKPPA